MIPAQQSPVNLEAAYPTHLGARRLDIRWSHSPCPVTGEVAGKEHELRVKFPFDLANRIELNGQEFILSEFHFHFPTEHYVDGSPVERPPRRGDRAPRRAMELHLVHQEPHDATLAVLGVFVLPVIRKRLSGDKCHHSDFLMQLVRQLRKRWGRTTAAEADADGDALPSTDARYWLPGDVTRYYRYAGSLTTPPYSETVSWVVFNDILEIPLAEPDWDELRKEFGHDSRSIQPLNRRFVLQHDDRYPTAAKK